MYQFCVFKSAEHCICEAQVCKEVRTHLYRAGRSKQWTISAVTSYECNTKQGDKKVNLGSKLKRLRGTEQFLFKRA